MKRKLNWEEICNRCALCCYEKKELSDGQWVICMDRPCPYLDEEMRKCRVYGRRFEANPFCLPMTRRMALFAPYLPESCAYVNKYRVWKRFCRFPAAEFNGTECSDS